MGVGETNRMASVTPCTPHSNEVCNPSYNGRERSRKVLCFSGTQSTDRRLVCKKTGRAGLLRGPFFEKS